MKKYERVKSNVEFNNIIQKGKKLSNKYFTIFFIESDQTIVRFGISAPKKLGNAVIRNKLKRQTRHLVDETKNLFKNRRNYIIITKEACLHSAFETKLKALNELIGEINET